MSSEIRATWVQVQIHYLLNAYCGSDAVLGTGDAGPRPSIAHSGVEEADNEQMTIISDWDEPRRE